MTKQKQLIFDIVNEAPIHMTADEIFHKAKQRMPSIVLATVYNNLNRLVEENQIRRLTIINQNDRFDRNVLSHAHLICDKCKSITDICPESNQWLQDVTTEKVKGYDLILYYTCKTCTNR